MTTKIEYAKPQGTYYSVLADGKFHTAVTEGTKGSVRREYETSDKKKGVKHELIAQSITGIISNIALYESDFGKNLQISFGDDLIVSLSTASNFGEDFMKKLPNINLDKEVKLVPYSFIDEETGKNKRGVTVYQDGAKVADYYHEKKNDKIKATNNYPEIPKESKEWDKEDWKIYFAQARKFLISEVQKSKKFNLVTEEKTIDYPTEEINPEDVPF